MCGIAGIINKNNMPVAKDAIVRMTDIITHRGPDGFGYYHGANFALGHRRLSILDLTEDGSQPMSYLDKYIITYNGEVYNYLELKSELIQQGCSFKSTSDTEVILAAYDKWGFDCVSHFVGMWAFCIYDKEKSQLFCSRDRFGIKPFYYFDDLDTFSFGSEIKQFTTSKNWAPTANINRVLDFLSFGIFDHTEETLFDGVYQLKAGHNLIYDLKSHSLVIQDYYKLDSKKESNKSDFEEASAEFLSRFSDSIKLHLRSDVKVGSCLSGGLDSSSIVCLANNILKEKNEKIQQETVSSCFEDKRYDEQKFIDEVVKSTNVVSHKVFPKFEDLFANLDEITYQQDEPFGSTSIFAQWNVFKMAKEKEITVMLDGQGADEQLAGYNGFFGVFLSSLLKRFRFITFYKEAKSLKKIHGYSNRDIFISVSKFMVSEYIKAFLKTKLSKTDFDWIILNRKYHKDYFKRLYSYKINSVENYSVNQLEFSSLPMLLHYEDRNSMAHSIESRVPFLDHRLVEFVLGLDAEFKIRNGVTKDVLREAMTGGLPDAIKNRADKMGFVTPEEVWIKENSGRFREELADACDYLNGIINKEKVLEWFDRLLKENAKIDFTIWRIISLGRWMKVFKVRLPLK
ncbi:MAG: asparagine synthase (glutamine-hydrolyzing) [Deltaproteobacteria bacterium]